MHWILVLVAIMVGCAGAPPHFEGGIREPLAIKHGRLLIAARLDGKPTILVVDTGASITSLSTAAARRLGVEGTHQTEINQKISAQLGMLRTLSIGVSEHADVPVVIVDLPNARDSNVKFDGILGLDVLARHDLVLDLSRRTFTLHPPGTFARMPITAQMQRIDISKVQHGLIMMQVTFGDHPPIPAFLDLGAPNSVVNNAAAKMLGARGPAFRPRDVRIGGAEITGRYFLVRDLSVFKYLGLSSQPAMLIGSDVFENRSLAIAFSDRVAYLSR